MNKEKADKKSPARNKKVLIALSGRVESAIAAFLLKKQGYKCMGLTFMMKDPADEFNSLLNGCRVDDLDKVKALCETLEIPFYATNAQPEFFNEIVDPVIASKLQGISFSPCMACNTLKFRLLSEKAKLLNVDFIATGHYAKVHYNQTQRSYQVNVANDHEADQSHLLSDVGQEALSQLILPLGEIQKNEVLKLAKEYNFDKLLSQPRKTCFYNSDKLTEFVEKSTTEDLRKEGQILNIDTGSFLGDHDGVHHFFLGQKEVSASSSTNSIDRDLSVVDIQPAKRLVQLGKGDVLKTNRLCLNKFRFMGFANQTKPIKCFFKIESIKGFIPATISFKSCNYAFLELKEEIPVVIKGQYATVFNREDRSAKIIGQGQVFKTHNLGLLHRAESLADTPKDEDGNELPIVGKEFLF
jgi:tRNA-specific 2-thiouridylase